MFLRVASGNESDSAVFAQIFRKLKQQLELDALMVADSALYTAPNIEQMASLRWLCRVPLTLKQAKQLIEQLNEKDFVESTIAGYRWAAQTSNYGGVRQRWLVVESEARRVSDLCQLEKNIDKAHQEAKKKLRWIFQCFQSVHFLQIATVKQISNLTQERLDILKFFPASCRYYYLLVSV